MDASEIAPWFGCDAYHTIRLLRPEGGAPGSWADNRFVMSVSETQNFAREVPPGRWRYFRSIGAGCLLRGRGPLLADFVGHTGSYCAHGVAGGGDGVVAGRHRGHALGQVAS